ncbi:MAG: hypothetical protein JWL93_1206 [Hyphomicrobiales bacterium]|jgi:hypothetical protein|nr:hypothetical protein [Hyphomicrobiales bacterium]
MNVLKTTCLATLLMLGGAALPAMAQSLEFGPGGVRVNPESRGEYRGGDVDRRDAQRAARRAGMDDIEQTSRRGGDWVVDGTDRRGRDMRVRVDGRSGEVIQVR